MNPKPNKKTVNPTLRGIKSRSAGQEFEKYISIACESYRQKGLAYIEKTPEAVKILSKVDAQGHFKACFEKQAQPDYKGTLKGGRSIVFEAKHTDKDRIEATRMTAEQSAALETHYNLGAMVFVLVSFSLERFYRIPYSEWRDMKKNCGRQYFLESELEGYKVSLLKFLSPLN